MKLFEKIPANFFSVLASPNRELYWTALVKLHCLLEYELNIPVADYCTALSDVLSDMDLVTEEGVNEEDQNLIRQPNGKIRWIISRLKRAGWLDTEYRDGTFEEVIAPRDYADRIIRLLLDLEASEGKEYNSLVFSSYSGLQQAYLERSDRMYEALMAARRNTTDLLNDLRSLYHNIRYYHQIIGETVSVNQLLHDYYDEYKRLLDRIYHPIKTMDSLPLYRQPILDILNGLLVDDELLDRTAARMVKLRPEMNESTAREELLQIIAQLQNAYASVEDILRQIDRKHRAYTRESVDSIKYRMSADHSIRGKLTELLQAYAGAAPGKPKAVMEELLQSGIQCESQAFADSASVWKPTVRSRRPGVPARKIEDTPPEIERELLAQLRAETAHRYSVANAWQYLSRALADRASITTEELALNNDTDFILLLIAVVRSTDRNAPYGIEFFPGQVQTNGYGLPQMRIYKKEGMAGKSGHTEGG